MIELIIALYLSFFKIGLFGFGGGYAMISLIQQELISHQWLDIEDFIDIIAIAEMTPGPIGINSATFVGYKVSSFIGSIVAVLGVLTPSFILVLILAYYFKKVKDSKFVNNLLLFLRPTVIALIFAAGFTIAKTSITDITSIIIAVSVLVLLQKSRIHPVILILLAGLSGAFLFS